MLVLTDTQESTSCSRQPKSGTNPQPPQRARDSIAHSNGTDTRPEAENLVPQFTAEVVHYVLLSAFTKTRVNQSDKNPLQIADEQTLHAATPNVACTDVLTWRETTAEQCSAAQGLSSTDYLWE
jgi:hypothetical protein